MKIFTLFFLIMLNCSSKKDVSQASSIILLSQAQKTSNSTKITFQNDTSFNITVTAIKTIQVNWKNWNSSLESKPKSIKLLHQASDGKDFETLSTFKNNARNETEVSVSSYLISKSSKFKLQSVENPNLQTGARVLTEESLQKVSGNMFEKQLTGLGSSALSSDGSVIALGDGSYNGGGAVHIYEKNTDGTWKNPTLLQPTGLNSSDLLGSAAIDLSDDGTVLAVSTKVDSTGAKSVNGDRSAYLRWSGAVYIYEKQASGNWTSSTYIKAKMGNPGGQLGVSVSLDKDGNTLAVGSQRSGIDNGGVLPSSGVVYVFQKESGNWKQKQLLESSNRYGYNFFGYSVSLSDDGKSLLIGSPSEDGKQTGVSIEKPKAKTGWSSSEKYKSGAAYLFQLENNTWEQKLYIKANNTGKDDRFGRSIAMSGDAKTIIVGAPYEDSNGNPSDNSQEKSGAVYIYKMQKEQWKFLKYLKATKINTSDEFGKSLSLSKDASSLIILSGYKSAFLY